MFDENEMFDATKKAMTEVMASRFRDGIRENWNTMLQGLPDDFKQDAVFMKAFLQMRPQFMVDEENESVNGLLDELNKHGITSEDWAGMPTAQKLLEHKRLGNEPPTFKLHVVLDGEHMDSDLSIRHQLWELLNKHATLILTSGDAMSYMEKPIPLFDQGGNRCGTMSLDWT